MSNYRFKLFVGNLGGKNLDYANEIKSMIEKEVQSCELEIIDVVEKPELAEKHNIMATPTLIRELPEPVFRVIGKMKNIRSIIT